MLLNHHICLSYKSKMKKFYQTFQTIDTVVSLNNNLARNSTTLILKRLDNMVIVKNRYVNKTENETGFILEKLNKIFIDNVIINNSINNIQETVAAVRRDVKQGREGYKIFLNNCPYNWTVSGYLKPFYICTK
jgi:hypothetical protein